MSVIKKRRKKVSKVNPKFVDCVLEKNHLALTLDIHLLKWRLLRFGKEFFMHTHTHTHIYIYTHKHQICIVCTNDYI